MESMIDIKGILVAHNVMLVAKNKKVIKGRDGASDDYYYDITFLKRCEGSDELLQCTAGKIFDSIKTFECYNVGFSYADKKLRIAQCLPVLNKTNK